MILTATKARLTALRLGISPNDVSLNQEFRVENLPQYISFEKEQRKDCALA